MNRPLHLFAGTFMLLALGVSTSFAQEFERSEQMNPVRFHALDVDVSGSPSGSSEAYIRALLAADEENVSPIAELDELDVFRSAKTAPSTLRLISSTYENWDGVQWTSDSRDLVTYDEEEDRAERISQRWDGTQWLNSTRILQTRGEVGPAKTEYQEWSGASWTPYSLYEYTYSAVGELKEIVHQRWRDAGWQLTTRYSYIHDEGGNVIFAVTEAYVDGTWVGEYRTYVTYDHRGRRIESADQQAVDGRWENRERRKHTYDDEAGTVEHVVLHWEDGVWLNRWRALEVVDHVGDVTEVTFQEGAGDAWINHSRIRFAVDEQDKSQLGMYERWENDEWAPDDRRTTRFDADGNRLETVVENWSWGEWVNWYRTTYEYERVSTAVEPHERLDSDHPTLHPTWPNPSHGATSFSFSLPEPARVRLEIFDVLGRRVQSLVEREMAPGDHHVTTSLADLPAGTYIYRLRAGDYETSRALIVHH